MIMKNEASDKTAASGAFPKRFFWGAATAAHQVEGGNHNQWSVWELENARTLAAQAPHKDEHVPVWESVKRQAMSPANYISGPATNHYARYEEDFDLLTDMHMNAYRFSIEWSRIEPKEGAWDAREIEHYRQYIAALKKRGIEPIATLFHFTLPVWFAEMGGFEYRRNVQYFVRFAEKVAEEFGASLRFIITINEPNIYVEQGYRELHFPPQTDSKWKAWRVLNNLAYAHNHVARALKRDHPRYKLSVAYYSSYFYPGDDAWLSNVSARTMQYVHDDYFLKKVYKHCDFLGVNYYHSNRVYGYRVHNPEEPVSDLANYMAPADIQFALERLWQKYQLPIMITENGVADQDDVHRKEWLRQTILGMQRAMKEGVKLIGYLHWSLLDNFEWGFGGHYAQALYGLVK
jgi:beta-glucosidase